MRPELSAVEARIVGCLIEKEITTPDQYPLTLNALTHAANQKSNRDPVMSLSESEVRSALEGLMRRHLITDRSGGAGGRVTRYRQRFCNTQFSQLSLSPPETAIVCELLLRGAQTPGELRNRALRMAPLPDTDVVESALEALAARDEPLVRRLPRVPGQREARWIQLFTGDHEAGSGPADVPAPPPAGASVEPARPGRLDRLDRLETMVDELQRRLAELEERLAQVEQRGREP
jgi:uncharacterized protein YceH (UPF0502 family)